MARKVPYGAFSVIVNFDGTAVGGFADVSGLGSDVAAAEYRYDNDAEWPVRKIPGVHKVGDVTLKRGIVSAAALWQWLEYARAYGVNMRKNVSVTLLDEARQPVQVWLLRNAIPLKYTGPALEAKGGDVAIEELVLSCEGMEIEAA